jgi:hypothetical protein
VVTYRSRTAKQQRSSYAGRKAKRQKNRKAKKQNSGKQQSKKEEPRETSKHKLPNNKKQRNSKKEMRNYKLLVLFVVHAPSTHHAGIVHRKIWRLIRSELRGIHYSQMKSALYM